MDWFNKGISKYNVIKALCFTQTDNTKDAVVRFCPSNCNHQNQLLAKIVIQMSLDILTKQIKGYQRATKKQNKQNR